MEFQATLKPPWPDVALHLLGKKIGGSVWESNPPKTLLTPPNGFEVRKAHRDSSAPDSSAYSSGHKAQPL